MKFYIDIAYATDVVVKTDHYIKQRNDESSEDFLVRKLRDNNIVMSSTKMIDHPKFTELREQLGQDGLISIERNCWNGDKVLKPFYLNDIKFNKGDTFRCAAAMKWTLTHSQVDK